MTLQKHNVRINFLTISIINPQGPGNYLGTNYFQNNEFFVKGPKHLDFNCLKYRVPPKIGLFQAKFFFWLSFHIILIALASLVSMSTFFPLYKFDLRLLSL